MIIDLTDIDFLNKTAVTEALPTELNTLFAVVLIFIGILFFIYLVRFKKKENRRLKKINRW